MYYDVIVSMIVSQGNVNSYDTDITQNNSYAIDASSKDVHISRRLYFS